MLYEWQTPEQTPNQRPMNLLLVDDDDIALLNYRRIADSLGCFSSIRSATDGGNALHILNQAEKGVFPIPDVILLDLEMPVINGVTFLKLLQKLHVPKKEEISIIVMIDQGSETRREAIRELGVRYFLTKPISFESFNDIVDIVTQKSSTAVLIDQRSALAT